MERIRRLKDLLQGILKKIIKDISSLDVGNNISSRQTSLSVGPIQPSSNTEEKSQKAQGEFIDALEKDMQKIELFVVGKLQEVRQTLKVPIFACCGVGVCCCVCARACVCQS